MEARNESIPMRVLKWVGIVIFIYLVLCVIARVLWVTGVL